MKFHARRNRGFPSFRDFEAREAHVLESRLRLAAFGDVLPAELQPEYKAPARPKRNPLGVFLKGFLILVIYVHLAWIFTTSVLIIAYRYVDPSVTVLMAYRKWTDGWKLERPRGLALHEVPRYLRSMLVAVEDDKFYQHHGIDPEAIKRAYEINSRLKRPLYGGSTLTMQVARTLFLVPVKSYVRKYFEVIATLELELFLPKDRILELYFGYAEWGKGVFGIEAASRHYYDRGVTKISRDEGARLIALLSSPIRFSPSTLQKSGILRERYAFLSNRASGSPAASQAAAVDKPPATPEPGEEAAAPADASVGSAGDSAAAAAAEGAPINAAPDATPPDSATPQPSSAPVAPKP